MDACFYLCGDIGATKTLLAVAGVRDAGVEIVFERRYANVEFAEFAELMRHFIGEYRSALRQGPPLASACLGIAGPVEDGRVEVTNFPWRMDAELLAAEISVPCTLVNDFHAAAYGIDYLAPNDVLTLQEGDPLARAPQLVIGAGTGLGVALRIWTGARYVVVPGEGGHVAFAPADTLQVGLWRALRQQFGRVSMEHVVCGRGLVRIYEFLHAENAAPETETVRLAMENDDPAAAIAYHALESDDVLSRRALDLFLECYGAAAGDYALGVLARGGVYLAGGIAPKLFPRLRTGPFVAAFTAKGHSAELARRFPVHVVMQPALGLYGAAGLAATATHRSTEGGDDRGNT